MKNNSGTLFRYYSKSKNVKDAPSFVGDAVVDGHTKKIVAWVKKARNGSDYLSIKFVEQSDPKTGKIIPSESTQKKNKRDMKTVADGRPIVETIDPDSIDLENLPF